MTDFEEPTQPQIELAKKLGIDPTGASKKGLSEKISAKIEANKGKKGDKPSEEKKSSPQPSKRGFEAHLSIEQVRTNALDAALRSDKLADWTEDFWDAVEVCEEYLLNGR